MTAPNDAVGNAKPSVVATEPDDFIVVKVSQGRRAPAFAVRGPGLAAEGIPFVTLNQAVTRGSVIAQNSRVSLWDATADGPAVLVTSFRR